MKIASVQAFSFSPTGNTAQVANALAQQLATLLDVPCQTTSCTTPAQREAQHSFAPGDLVILATPVYAGRVPNKLLPFFQTKFEGNGALGLPLVAFGNRNFDNGLIELRNEMEAHGFHTIAGAGVATSHVFSDKIAPGRPDQADLDALMAFAAQVAQKVQALEQAPTQPQPVRGDDPVGPYYTPKGTDGKPAVFLKAKPKTHAELCTECGLCVNVCPMGSISAQDPAEVPGLCIKCQACIRSCPTGAKYLDDPAFLSHVAMLEQNFTRRAEPEFFV